MKKILQGAAKGTIAVAKPSTWREKGIKWSIFMGSILLTIAVLLTMLYWSRTPALFDVSENATKMAKAQGVTVVTGYTTVATLIRIGETLLDKPGGYLSNDVASPGTILDNMPNWEFGALVQIRDITRALRNDISRSQSQSVEDKDLIIAEPQFNFDSESWMLPDTEGEYRKGIKALKRYELRLSDPKHKDAQFYARADNLRDWLALVEKRLGSLSTRLSAAIGQDRVNTDMAGDSAAQQSTPRPANISVKTPWTEIDDVFFEARGASWALIQLLRAIEIDFAGILQKKNAVVSLRQIIRELEPTQERIWSPIILNGHGFSLVSNHSLIMASYISRANAAIIDLRALLENG